MSVYVYQNHEVYFLVIYSVFLEIITEQESALPPEVRVPRHVQNANVLKIKKIIIDLCIHDTDRLYVGNMSWHHLDMINHNLSAKRIMSKFLGHFQNVLKMIIIDYEVLIDYCVHDIG